MRRASSCDFTVLCMIDALCNTQPYSIVWKICKQMYILLFTILGLLSKYGWVAAQNQTSQAFLILFGTPDNCRSWWLVDSILSKKFGKLREIGLKSPNVEQWNKKPYLQGSISKDCSDQKVNCSENLLSRKAHIWLLASNNGVSSHFFLGLFQRVSFFHNYCGEFLCLVSTHLCLLCHFYVVYELFILFWVESYSNSNSKSQWRNDEVTKFGPKGLGKWKTWNSK